MSIFFEEHTFVLACRPWQTITSVIIDRDTSSLRVERKKWMMSEGSTMPCGSFLKMPTLPGSLPSLPASTHHTGCHHHHLQHHHHGNHLKIMNNYEPTLKNPENLALAAGGWSGLIGAEVGNAKSEDFSWQTVRQKYTSSKYISSSSWSQLIISIAKITSLCRVTRYDHHCPNLYDKRPHHLWIWKQHNTSIPTLVNEKVF